LNNFFKSGIKKTKIFKTTLNDIEMS